MGREYAYTRTELGRDYVRALIGLAICVAPFIWVTPAIFLIVILGAMAAVFALLLWQTLIRQITRITLDGDGITLVALRRRTIPWDRLQRFQLSYFTTGKNIAGFMELKLKGAGTTMRVGSGLIGFRDVVAAASRAAYRNGVDFKRSSIDNLLHLNIPDPHLDDVADVIEGGGRPHG